MTSREPGKGWFARNWWVVASLGAITLLAVYIRLAFNLPIFVQEGLEFAGNDPYYHLRAIRNIVESGHHFFEDPMINYPHGFENPNPPTFNWSVAILSVLLGPFFGGAREAIMWVQGASPVLWGGLTVLLVYWITAEVFDKKAGVIAAFLMAVMASHIERSMFGFADHDSYILFFITLGMFFYLKALKVTSRRDWVSDWTDGGQILDGLREYGENARLSLVYASLAGLSIANVALAWKGFHYAMAILFGYAVFQLVFDQIRGEDSLDIFAITLVTMGIVLAMAWPWYEWAGLTRWFGPSIYILAGFLVVGLVLVPARDLPAVLVLPGFVGFIAAVLAIIAVAFPGLSEIVFGGFGYFQRTAVYRTIAEAHPPDFSNVVFNFGVATFYLALIGIVLLAIRLRRELTLGRLFMLVWATISIYMGLAAARFLFNASVVFAVMSGWMTWWIIDRLDYDAMFTQLRGFRDSLRHGVKRAVGISHVIGVLFLALAIVVPNTYFALDAGMPSQYESQLAGDDEAAQRFVQTNLGAFGQSYLPGYWEEGLEWLKTQDDDLPPPDRPGFMSWWDYGFWTSALGDHPVVADNFQNNFFFAGRFLAAQNETHGLQILVAGFHDNKAITEDQLRSYLRDAGVEEADLDETVRALEGYRYTSHLDHEQTLEVYRRATEDSGKIVRYVAIDQRLFPFDDPRTPRIDSQSIFFAPITLAEFNPDDFVQTKITATIVGPDGQSRQVQVTQAELRRLQQQVQASGGQVSVDGQSLEYKQRFFNTMIYRVYVGSPPRAQPPGDARILPQRTQPCFGMENFRVAFQNRGLRICKFYFGAHQNGTVETTTGEPLDRVSVSPLDPSGIPHGTAVTDTNGSFDLRMPFGEIRVVAFAGRGQNQILLGDSGNVTVTDEQAMSGARLDPIRITVEPADVEGRVFFDRDGDGTWNPANDTVLRNATVTVGDRTTTSGDDGTYRLEDVKPGRRLITAEKDGYRAQPQRVSLRPNETTTHNVSMTLTPVEVSGRTYVDDDGDGTVDAGEGLSNVSVAFSPTDAEDNTGQANAATSNATGGYEVLLTPGSYEWRAEGVRAGTVHRANGTLEVPVGGDPIALDIALEPGS